MIVLVVSLETCGYPEKGIVAMIDTNETEPRLQPTYKNIVTSETLLLVPADHELIDRYANLRPLSQMLVLEIA